MLDGRHLARFRNIPGKLGEAFNIMPVAPQPSFL